MRNKLMSVKVYSSLAYAYCMRFLESEDDKYLYKIRSSINEARKLASNTNISKDDDIQLTVLFTFTEVYLNYKNKEAKKTIGKIRRYPRRLERVIDKIKQKVFII